MSTAYPRYHRRFGFCMRPHVSQQRTPGSRQSNMGMTQRFQESRLRLSTSIFPGSVETQKGHMKKQRKNVRSTKQKLILDEPTEDVELTQAITKQTIFVKVVNARETVYSD